MAITNLGKQVILDEGIDGATRYVTLHLADDSLLDINHGYSPRAVTPAQISVGLNGVVTLPQNLEMYVANDDNAQRARKIGLARNVNGSNLLLSPEDIANPPIAPVNGQALQMTITFTP